jgi:hypothetical protein
MKHLLCSSLIAFVFSVQAQTLSPSVISSTGCYGTSAANSLSYTVGELAAVQTFTSSSGSVILTQGFQQPNDIVSGLLNIEANADGAFSVYPVPASATVWYGYEFTEPGNAEVSLVNILGQKLNYGLTESYNSGKLLHSFDCAAYASGDYILSVKFTSACGQEKILSKKIQFITN